MVIGGPLLINEKPIQYSDSYARHPREGGGEGGGGGGGGGWG